ncbi:MAG: ATP-binding protein [Bacteroidales bacterium]|jgi:predicted HTH transcriptional regulator|nr:ATP-binding protein [Bacteroidales bacterium]
MLENQKYIKERISGGEGLHLDFKHSISDAKKIARSLVAFANTEGGSLLIGVRDNGSIAGVRSEEEYYMIETAAIMYCKPVVEFRHKNWNINGMTILEIIVGRSENKPHYAPDTNDSYRAFIRKKDQNLVAPKVLVEVWKRQKKEFKGIKLKYDDVVEALFNEITLNGFITKSHLTRLTGIRSYQADKLLSSLMLMDILDLDMTEHYTRYIFNETYKREF